MEAKITRNDFVKMKLPEFPDAIEVLRRTKKFSESYCINVPGFIIGIDWELYQPNLMSYRKFDVGKCSIWVKDLKTKGKKIFMLIEFNSFDSLLDIIKNKIFPEIYKEKESV